jgi:glycosyltransferase involved in cell wall biosynthesis
MGIGLGLISHNEEHMIARCLDSFFDVGFDDICLIVNNSTDRTYELACKWRAENFPSMHIDSVEIKPFSFAVARNMYVDYLDDRVDFIFSVDTDDLATPELIAFLKELKAMETVEQDVVAFQYRTGRDSAHMNFRLFRTKVGTRYSGAVHEYLDCKPELVRMASKIEVIHHPTALDHYDTSAKRNLDIFRDMASKPTRREVFYYANTLRDMKKWDDAVKAYQEYRTEPYLYYDEWCHTWIYEARCRRFLNQSEEAVKVLEEFVQKDGSWGVAWMELCYNYYFARKSVPLALSAAARAQGCPFRHRLFEEGNKSQDGSETIKYLKLCFAQLKLEEKAKA